MEINTGRIDSEYMNSRFKKYLRELGQKDIDPEELQATLDDLHKSFAALTQEEQKFATIFLHDVQCAAVQVEPGKTFREYVTEYMVRAKNDQVHRLAVALGLDENQLRALMNAHVNEQNGEPLAKNCSLVFTAITGAKHHYQIKWQVVNTGAEATTARGLRGGFENSDIGLNKKKESTYYSGCHSVQCFVICKGACVAKSRLFIVNII